MNIGIIGGSDGLGKTLIYHLKDEFNVAFSGRDHNKGMKELMKLTLHIINLTLN